MKLLDLHRLRYPIVLVHGMGARSHFVICDYFFGLKRHFEKSGNRVLVAHLPAWQTIENRAAELKRQIDKAFPDGEKVNLIAHSMGGLDSRYLISRLGFGDRVASLTTIGTTHRGSHLADIVTGKGVELLSEVSDEISGAVNAAANQTESGSLVESAAASLATGTGGSFRPRLSAPARALRLSHELRGKLFQTAVEPLPYLYHSVDRIFGIFGATARGLTQVTTQYCQNEFPVLAPDLPGVGYFSAVTVIAKPAIANSLPVFWVPHAVLFRAEGDNDGFVSESSARYGEVICTAHGDHYAQIGHLFGHARGGMNHLTFYETIVRRLRREGF